LGTVHFTSSDGQAILPGDRAFVPDNASVYSFTMILNSAGTQTVQVRDVAKAALAANVSISVQAATPGEHLSISIQPTAGAVSGTDAAGALASFTVTALTAAGAVDPNYRGTIHFTSTDTVDPAHILPGNYTFTANDKGKHTFTNALAFCQAGPRTLAATDTANGTIFGSTTVQVLPAPKAGWFTVAGPASATAGRAFNITVTALDLFNNRATSYGGTVRFTSSDPAAVLPPAYTFTPGNRGQQTFSVIAKTAGPTTFTVTDTADGSVLGVLQVSVNPVI
jgi:hypothetical protein